MAASMNFKPGGYEYDEDDDEFDGFCVSGTPILQQLDAVARKNSAQIPETNQNRPRGGFGDLRNTTDSGPSKKYKRSSHKMSEAENKPKALDNGDFQLAVMRGQADAVRDYLDKGFPVDTVLRTGWTGLMYASSHANPGLVQMFVDHGADSNFHKDMYTVLMAACGPAGYKEEDVLQCVNILLQQGVDVNSYDRYHTTALMCAAREGRSEVIRVLVNDGAIVDKQDNRGWAALSWAVSKRHRAAVGTLLELGANPRLKHSDGTSVIQMAEYDGLDQMVDLLQGKTSAKSDTGSSSVTDDVANQDLSVEDSGRYGELELFLCGLDLTRLIGLFRSQQVDFAIFLTMTEEDLIKIGITQIGVRKKILDGIHDVHNKQWENSSLVESSHKKLYSCAEMLAIIANISKHTKYISTTAGSMRSQLKKHPQIVEDLQDGTGCKQLHGHTVDTLKNIDLLRQQLTNLKAQLEQKMKTGNYNPPDVINTPTQKPRWRKRLGWSAVVIGATVIGVLLWKREDLLETHVVGNG